MALRRPDDEVSPDHARRRTNWHSINVALPLDDYAELRDTAERQGTSIADLVRDYITWGLENDER